MTRKTNGNGADFDVFKFAADFDPMKMADQWQKMVGDFGVSTAGMDAVLATQRKTFEALSAANTRAFEGVREISKRQAEIVRNAVEESTAAMTKLGKVKSPNEAAEIQAEMARTSFDKAVKDLDELRKLVVETNTAVAEPINERIRASFDEVKELTASFQK